MIVSVGIDLVDVARVERMLRAKGERALRRLCTDREAEYVRSRHSSAASFAARLAAKEAAFKALSGTDESRGIGWRDIEVVSGLDRRPTLVLHGLAQRRAEQLGVTIMHLSITHTVSTAAAVVTLERE
jgi:holo-[acyl-carrier protein] synthase